MEIICSLIAAVHLRKFAAEVCKQMHLVPQSRKGGCAPLPATSDFCSSAGCACVLTRSGNMESGTLAGYHPREKCWLGFQHELLIHPVGKMTSVEKATFVKEQSRREFEWTLE